MARSYPYMTLDDVLEAEPIAEEGGVSQVARSKRGFMRAYEKADGSPARMGEESTSGQLWVDRRRNFVARHMAQVRKRKEPLWKNGAPTRRHLALMMWAFTSTPARTERWLDRLYEEET